MNSKASIILKVSLAVLNLFGLCIGGYFVYISTLGYEPKIITEQSLRSPASTKETVQFELPDHLSQGPHIYTMDKFVVNLSGEPKRSIRLEVNLDMINGESYQEVMSFENKIKARDRIVRILNAKSFYELETIQGKLFLKDKMVEEINKVLLTGLVKDIYFTDFVMN